MSIASDYVKDDKSNNFGFKCLVVGYEGFSTKEEGLKNLEMELAFLGGTCAASLMKKNIPLNHQNGFNTSKEDVDLIDDSAAEAYEMHSSLLNKGFALERYGLHTLDTIPFFHQITTFIKVRVTFVFGLQTPLIDRSYKKSIN